jgi:hypothetical protein
VVGEPEARAAEGATTDVARGNEGGPGLDDREARELEEHLRGLGYLE